VKKCLALTNKSGESSIIGHGPTVQFKDPAWMQVQFFQRDPIEIPIHLWIARGLKDGLVLTSEDIAHLEQEAEIQAWRSKVLRYLALRPRTAEELSRYLERKGAAEGVVAGVLKVCREEGWVDDRTYTKEFIRTRVNASSRREVEWKLRQRGVSSEDLATVLDSKWNEATEVHAALQLASKYVRSHSRLSSESLRDKLWTYLHRKGFNIEACRHAVLHVVGELESIAHTEFLDND